MDLRLLRWNSPRTRRRIMADLFDLTGRNAVITGAANGIGRAIALGMARQGADVAICDLDKEGLQSALAEVTVLGRRGVAVRCDVEQPDQIARFFSEIDASLGQ